MFKFMMCLLMMLWHRFLWPFILLYIGTARTGNALGAVMALEGGANSNSSGVEKVSCYINMVLMVIFIIVPKTFVYTLLPSFLVTALQVGIVFFKSAIGVCAFGWVFSIGGIGRNNNQSQYTNNRVGYQSNSVGYQTNQYGLQNQQMINQQLLNQQLMNGSTNQLFGRHANNRRNVEYQRNVEVHQAVGTIGNEEQWLIREAKKQTYINKSGKIVYAYKKVRYELQGFELCEVNGIKLYAFNVTTGFDTLVERLPDDKVTYCTSRFFKLVTKGFYYFITNQGEVINDVLSLYNPVEESNVQVEVVHVTSELKLYVLGDVVSLNYASERPYTRNVLVPLRQDGETLVGELESKYSIGVLPTRKDRNGEVSVYVFDINTFDLLKDTEQSPKVVNEIVEASDERVLNNRVVDNTKFMYKGLTGVRVENSPHIHLLENNHLAVQYNGSISEFIADKELQCGNKQTYLFMFDMHDVMYKYLNQLYIRKKLVKDGVLYLCVTEDGEILDDYEESNTKEVNTQEEEEERLTVQDLKEKVKAGVKGFKVLKMKAEDISVQVKNRGMIKDGIYNTGAVDLMCRFGELRCCIYEERFPVLQALYIGKLVAPYAVPDIIDKISDTWYEDVPLQNFYNQLGIDLDSLIGQKQDAVINIWVVKGDVIYYLSTVLYLGTTDEEAAVVLQYTKRFIMMCLSNEFSLEGNDTVCYLESISSAEKNRLVLNHDTVLANEDVEKRHYYDINVFDANPDVIMKRCIGLTAEEIKSVKDVFSDIGVTFSMRYPLIQSVASDSVRLIKFLADEMMMNMIDESKISRVELPTGESSVYKICKYLDSTIFGTKVQVNVIKKWRKNCFFIRTKVADGFEYSFIQLDTRLLQEESPILSTIRQPVIALSFWSVNGESVIEHEGNIELYLFKKG